MIYVFCFSFSLRLGVVLISVFSVLKGTCILVLLTYRDVQDLKGSIEKFLLVIGYNTGFVTFVVQEFEVLVIALITFLVLYLASCVLMAIGAFLCRPILCYSFLPLQLVFLIFDLLIYSVFFKYLLYLAFLPLDERNQSTLGMTEVILCLSAAIFGVFYEVYQWVCVYSFIMAVNVLYKQISNVMSVVPLRKQKVIIVRPQANPGLKH